MKFSKDTKVMLITAIASAGALFAVISKNINAGQQYGGAYNSHGYGPGYQYYAPGYKYPPSPGYQYPASPGYQYYAPGKQSRMQVTRQPSYITSTAKPSIEEGSTTNVTIAGMQFQPATIRVKSGEQVTWINAESMPHTVTSQTSNVLASERLGRGGAFTHTFDQPGTYTYYCALHPSMTGRVIVE